MSEGLDGVVFVSIYWPSECIFTVHNEYSRNISKLRFAGVVFEFSGWISEHHHGCLHQLHFGDFPSCGVIGSRLAYKGSINYRLRFAVSIHSAVWILQIN